MPRLRRAIIEYAAIENGHVRHRRKNFVPRRRFSIHLPF